MEDEKIFILASVEKFLIKSGVGPASSNVITFIVAFLILLLLIRLFKYVGSHIVSKIVAAAVKRSETQWDNFLSRRSFHRNAFRLVAAIIIFSISQTLFQGFGTTIQSLAETIISIYIVFAAVKTFNSLIDTINDYYETKPQSRQKSIRSVLQSVKIVALIIAVILVVSILLRKNPTDLLVALGASAAVVSLVFKDTILGFVASIQVSAQDMIRPGDWIEMPARGADGMVSEINITNVKIRNWDNSVSMVPTYAMVSESFTNWRTMQESDGRRFKRTILIDVNSVSIISQDRLTEIINNTFIDTSVANIMKELMTENNKSNFMTNLGLYRCYVEAYLQHHPKVAQNQLRVVRYLDYSESGIIIQLYAFSKDKDLLHYEHVISDIYENVIVAAPFFSLKLFQRPNAIPQIM